MKFFVFIFPNYLLVVDSSSRLGAVLLSSSMYV